MGIKIPHRVLALDITHLRTLSTPGRRLFQVLRHSVAEAIQVPEETEGSWQALSRRLLGPASPRRYIIVLGLHRRDIAFGKMPLATRAGRDKPSRPPPVIIASISFRQPIDRTKRQAAA